jgi:hypothetical protein
MNDFRTCNVCKEIKLVEEFYKERHRKLGRDYTCKICRAKKATAIPKKIVRKRNLQYGYNITTEKYMTMLQEQNNVCAICKQPETVIDRRNNILKALCIDHSHKTGKIRKLLCQRCNTALGLLQENFETAQNLAKYIKYHTEVQSV